MAKIGGSVPARAKRGGFCLLFALLLTGCDPVLPPSCRIPESEPEKLAALRQADEVVLDDQNLAALLFDGNLAIHIATNRLHQAKAELNAARAELLPSLNLSALLLSAGQPQFAWAAVEAVVPFLIPGNWFGASQARDMFEAEKLALQIVEQNQYASAFSMISLWKNDLKLLAIMEEEFIEARSLRQRAQQAYDLGLITIDELNQAISVDQFAEISVAQVREMLSREEASLRKAFGLKSGTALRATEDSFDVPGTPSEGQAVDELVGTAMKRSPESLQLVQIEEAARKGRWKAAFAFMGGIGLSKQAEKGKFTRSMENLSAAGGIQLSFGYFPALEISSRNIRELELRREEIRLEFQELFESIQAGLASTQLQAARHAEREQTARAQYENMKLKVELGLAEPWQLLDAEGALRQARLDLLRSRTELALVRLSWQRTLQEGVFATLSPCLAEPAKK
jgi:outer membrane protein TolC